MSFTTKENLSPTVKIHRKLLIKQRQIFCREIYVRFIDLIDFFKFLTVVIKHMYTLL